LCMGRSYGRDCGQCRNEHLPHETASCSIVDWWMLASPRRRVCPTAAGRPVNSALSLQRALAGLALAHGDRRRFVSIHDMSLKRARGRGGEDILERRFRPVGHEHIDMPPADRAAAVPGEEI